MTQNEQDRIIGERLRVLTEKRKSLSCYEAKARELAEDMEAIAKVLSPYRGGKYISSEHDERRRLWAGKLEGTDKLDNVSWPDWEELRRTFQEIVYLKSDIDRLVTELNPFGIK